MSSRHSTAVMELKADKGKQKEKEKKKTVRGCSIHVSVLSNLFQYWLGLTY